MRCLLLCLPLLLLPGCSNPRAQVVSDVGGVQHQADFVIGSDRSGLELITFIAEEMQRQQPELRVGILQQEPGKAVGELARGQLDGFTSPGPLSPDERAALKQGGIVVVAAPLAMDALVAVVGPQNSFAKDVKKGELQQIWAFDAKENLKWSDVRKGWPAIPILRALPNELSFASHAAHMLKRDRLADTQPLAVHGVATLPQLLATEPGALGLVRYSYAQAHKEKLRMLSVDGIPPTASTLSNGTYPLSAPLILYVSRRAVKGGSEIEAFVEEARAQAGGDLARMGFVPLPLNLRQPLDTKTR